MISSSRWISTLSFLTALHPTRNPTHIDHPFYTIEGEWVEAENLTIGDLIWSLDGDYGTVEAIDLIHTQQPMYNLTVDEAHTFFVGSGDWLVHNTNSNKCFTVLFQADLEKGLDYPLPGSTEAQLVAARRAHNKAANRQLNEALNSDPSFKAWMEQNYPDIVEHVKPGKRGAHQRYAPPDWEWHHVTDQEGVLWLMSADIHDELFGILHDYPPGRGGLSIWGTKPE